MTEPLAVHGPVAFAQLLPTSKMAYAPFVQIKSLLSTAVVKKLIRPFLTPIQRDSCQPSATLATMQTLTLCTDTETLPRDTS